MPTPWCWSACMASTSTLPIPSSTATDPDTGLDCHFKAMWNTRFVEVRTVGEIPPMTEALRTQILANLGNTPALMDLLPPEHFLLHGFLVLNALEVTDQ